MPLGKVTGDNIARLIREGYPRDQAIAIALSHERNPMSKVQINLTEKEAAALAHSAQLTMDLINEMRESAVPSAARYNKLIRELDSAASRLVFLGMDIKDALRGLPVPRGIVTAKTRR